MLFGWLQKLFQSNKAIVSAAGTAATALTFAHQFSAFLPASAVAPVGTLFAVLTPLFTWLIPNVKPAA